MLGLRGVHREKADRRRDTPRRRSGGPRAPQDALQL
jgi:hypothetical protein